MEFGLNQASIQIKGKTALELTRSLEVCSLTWPAIQRMRLYAYRSDNSSTASGSSQLQECDFVFALWQAASYVARDWSYFLQKPMSIAFSTLGQEVHVTKPVGELLFDGYSDPVISMGSSFPLPPEIKIPYDKFGWFYQVSETSYSHCMGIAPDDATGRRVFSGISRFPHHFIPTPLHISITLIGSQDLAVKSRPNLFTSLYFCFTGNFIHCERTRIIIIITGLPWRSRLVRRQSRVREALGSNPTTLASHQGEPGSIPGRVNGLSQAGIVPDDAVATFLCTRADMDRGGAAATCALITYKPSPRGTLLQRRAYIVRTCAHGLSHRLQSRRKTVRRKAYALVSASHIVAMWHLLRLPVSSLAFARSGPCRVSRRPPSCFAHSGDVALVARASVVLSVRSLLDHVALRHSPFVCSNGGGRDSFQRNGSTTYDGLYNMDTGTDDINKLGDLRQWNHRNHTDYYPGSCSEIHGSAGQLWPPARKRTDRVAMYSTDLCRRRPCKLPRYIPRGSVVVRLLASHRGDPGSIPGGVTTGFPHVRIVLDDAAGRRWFFFSGISRFSPLLHSGAAPYSTRFTRIGSQDAAQISPLHSALLIERRTSNRPVKCVRVGRRRSIWFDYAEDAEVDGLPAYRYSGGASIVDNGTLDSGNECYCGGRCVPAGVLNVSSCRFGSPAFVSYPHFYLADPYYLDQVDGLHPQADKHRFDITIEPAKQCRESAALRTCVRDKLHISKANVAPIPFTSTICNLLCTQVRKVADSLRCSGSGGRAVSPLASHQCKLDSMPGRVTGFSHVGIMPDDAVVGGFSRGSPDSPALSFRRRSILTSITFIGSQDPAVKSRSNLFTHSALCGGEAMERSGEGNWNNQRNLTGHWQRPPRIPHTTGIPLDVAARFQINILLEKRPYVKSPPSLRSGFMELLKYIPTYANTRNYLRLPVTTCNNL
ncbi:hypothetical protein PR048_003435 [Dryococelus australis]|uniref:Uncharacterized protein n=1 Tax=Dryococelus australis TaxID=614101 RepID=A0ABQ9IPI8_9NEOP|nr:hypothetical protein PR048_003435 [Dryococelus australis]